MSSSRLNAIGIPSSFKCLGHTVKIKEIPDLPDVGRHGDWCEDTNEIRLYTHGVDDSLILHSFYHELMHCLLNRAGYTELSADETLVDIVGGLLGQFHTTRRYQST